MILTLEEIKQHYNVNRKFYGSSLHKATIGIMNINNENHYHTNNHIEYMLKLRRNIYSFSNNTSYENLTYAIYFHDCVYNSLASSGINEDESVEMFKHVADNHVLYLNDIEEISNMILATKFHTEVQDVDVNTRILLDLDLAILGDSPKIYKSEYSDKIALEYLNQGVDEKDYLKGRIKFLENMLSKPRIYYTPQMYVLREWQARRNMTTELGDMYKLLDMKTFWENKKYDS